MSLEKIYQALSLHLVLGSKVKFNILCGERGPGYEARGRACATHTLLENKASYNTKKL